MTVLMTGGTGFLGTALRRRLADRGDTITCLSRSRRGAEGATTFAHYDDLGTQLAHDAVVNLAGESVVGLWTRSKRRRIYRSRIETTRLIVEWIERQAVKPNAFLSGSAVGIYGDRGDVKTPESTDVSRSNGFLAQVCRDWEQAAQSAAWRGTRTILLRTGHVLDRSGGFLAKALPMMRRLPVFVLGRSDAYFPWIALQDWVDLVFHAIENEEICGPLNLTAPKPATQEEFTQAVASSLGKRVWGVLPPWLMRLGAGEFGSSVTFSQRAIPAKALTAGYKFQVNEIGQYSF